MTKGECKKLEVALAAAARDLILLNLVVLVKNWRGPGTISRIIQFEVSINQSLNQICYCCEKNSAFKPLCVKPKNRPCIRAKTEVGRKIIRAKVYLHDFSNIFHPCLAQWVF